jgi:S-adenosylmethionine decarboxylase proenzyme
LKALGHHLLVELFKCDRVVLNDVDFVRQSLRDAATYAGATILTDAFHQFSPQGVSGVVVIAESHLSIHTWPEYEYAALDVFTCGETIKPEVAVDFIAERLKAEDYTVVEVKRGTLKLSNGELFYKKEEVACSKG